MENKLLIVPIFKSFSLLRKLGYKKILQNKKFRYGIRIKNVNDKPFEGGLIKKISLEKEGGNVAFNLDKEFKIPSLNPGEICLIWIENHTFRFSGGFWIKFKIESKEQTFTYQWNEENNRSDKIIVANEWHDLRYVEDENYFQQKVTNILLIILTFILVIKGLFL